MYADCDTVARVAGSEILILVNGLLRIQIQNCDSEIRLTTKKVQNL